MGKIPVNTYGRIKKSSKGKKRPLNLSKFTVDVIVPQYITEYHFHYSSTSDSGDAFDKLLKGPTYTAPDQSSAPSFSQYERKFFTKRQETHIFYTSNVTPGSSSVSSVHLFRDTSKDSSDLSSLSKSPLTCGKKKSKVIKSSVQKKNCNKVVKKRHKNLFKSQPTHHYQNMIPVLSSTPTDSLCIKPQSGLIGSYLSPIVPPLNIGLFKNNDSVENIFEDISGNKKTESNIINTPKSIYSTKHLLAIRESEERQSKIDTTKISDNLKDLLAIKEIEETGNSSDTSKSNCSAEDLFAVKENKENVDDTKLKSSHGMTAIIEGLGHLGLFTPQHRAVSDVGVKTDCKKELRCNSKCSLPVEKDKNDVDNLKFDNKTSNISGDDNLYNLKLEDENKQGLPFLLQKKRTESNLSEEKGRLKLSLDPGKGWRRSYLRQKHTETMRSSMEPSLLIKLVRNSIITKREGSRLKEEDSPNNKIDGIPPFHQISENSLVLNNSFDRLRKVTTRKKTKYNYKHEYSMGEIPEEKSIQIINQVSDINGEYRHYSEADKNEAAERLPITNTTYTLENDSFKYESESKYVNKFSLTQCEYIKKATAIEPDSLQLLNSYQEAICETSSSSMEGEHPIREGKANTILNEKSVFEISSFFKTGSEECLSAITRRKKPNLPTQLEYFQDDTISSIPCSSKDKSVESHYEATGEIDFSRYTENIQDTSVVGEECALVRCGQEQPLSFTDAFPDRILNNSKKIGEGVFGEVFMLQRSDTEQTVVKLIPVEGSQLVNNERQKLFDEVLSELIITEELSLLRRNPQFCTSGFCELKNKFVLQGTYPVPLIDQWREFDKTKGSENDCPDIFGCDQKYIALELEHAGEPIETYCFPTAKESYFVFLQTLSSLAIAEHSLKFEHRDLHIGNVLVKNTSQESISFVHNDFHFKIPSQGIKATIIDFTLSRMSIDNDVLFCDLANDPEQFTIEGDFQFEVYRQMKEDLNNTWINHSPKTNIRWLFYLLDKFLTKIKYKQKRLRVHKKYTNKLSELKREIVDFNSASQFAEYLTQTRRDILAV